MEHFKTAATIMRERLDYHNKKGEFELQLTLSIAPSLMDYFLRIASHFVKRHFSENPGITPEEMLKYQDDISSKVKDQISSHSKDIVASMSANLFHETDTECQPKASVSEKHLQRESPGVDTR